MRQAILVILLVGAAFLGGAFINGPGLQWAQSRVLRLLGLNGVGEIAAVDLETSPNGETGADSTRHRTTGDPCTYADISGRIGRQVLQKRSVQQNFGTPAQAQVT